MVSIIASGLGNGLSVYLTEFQRHQEAFPIGPQVPASDGQHQVESRLIEQDALSVASHLPAVEAHPRVVAREFLLSPYEHDHFTHRLSIGVAWAMNRNASTARPAGSKPGMDTPCRAVST